MAKQGKKNSPDEDGLNIRQRLFVKCYLIDRNATKAAADAGYSAKTAGQIGGRLLRNVQILRLIEQSEQKVAEKLNITHERIVTELARIGFADIRKIVQWGDGMAVRDPESGETTIANGVSLISSESIDDDTAASISEISQTAQGLKVKMHDKRGALVDLGKHLGMFKEKVEITGAGGGPIQTEGSLDVSGLSIEQLKVLASIPVKQ